MMTAMLPWVITCLVAALLAGFAGYLVGLYSLPTAERPRTRTYNRFGEFIEERENPDYHENPGEDAQADPAIRDTAER